jgi:hypothetical protein
MEELPLPPQVDEFHCDRTDDTLSNASISYGLASLPLFQTQSSSLSLISSRGRLTDVFDEKGTPWTKCRYKFYFHIYDEYRSGRLESMLLGNHSYHSRLEPITIFEKQILEGKEARTVLSPSLFVLSFNGGQTAAEPKTLRPERQEVLVTYTVHLRAVARPITTYYQLTCDSPSLSSQSSHATILDDLIRLQRSDLSPFLSLWLMMAHELGEIHSQGLCHSELGMDSFLLYTPSSTPSSSNEWGVQLMGHWLLLPSGLCDYSSALHTPNTTVSLPSPLHVSPPLFSSLLS